MFKKTTLLFLLLIPISLYAQTPKYNVVAAAAKMGSALVHQDFTTFMESTYPAAIAKNPGGQNQMLRDLRKQLNAMAAQGTTLIRIWPAEPSVMIDTANELQCTLPQNMIMKIKGGKIETVTTLIGISPDKGTTWYFIDAADSDINVIRSQFPNISSQLVIPKAPEPVFTADKTN